MIQNDELSNYYCDYRYCGILHDKDTYEETTDKHLEGDLKKPHYHIVLVLKNATRRETLSKRLGIEATMIEPCEKLNASLCYLIHLNVEKYQYDTTDLFGDVEYISKINEISIRENKALIIFKIFEFIEHFNGELSMFEFQRACYQNGWSLLVSKNQLMINNAIKEHNLKAIKRTL